MFDRLKTLWQRVFPPATSGNNNTQPPATLQQPLAQPQQPAAPIQNQPFVLSPAASNYIDAAWLANQNKVLDLPKGTSLWHGGLIGPNNPVINAKGLWTTRDAQRKTFYNQWAKDDAVRHGGTAYLTEYSNNATLPLADFNRHSMTYFTETFCNGSHDLMKASLIAWVQAIPSLRRGIVAINSGPDEVVIAYPATDLDVVVQTLI